MKVGLHQETHGCKHRPTIQSRPTQSSSIQRNPSLSNSVQSSHAYPTCNQTNTLVVQFSPTWRSLTKRTRLQPNPTQLTRLVIQHRPTQSSSTQLNPKQSNAIQSSLPITKCIQSNACVVQFKPTRCNSIKLYHMQPSPNQLSSTYNPMCFQPSLLQQTQANTTHSKLSTTSTLISPNTSQRIPAPSNSVQSTQVKPIYAV